MSGRLPLSVFNMQRAMFRVGHTLFLICCFLLFVNPGTVSAQDTLILKNGRKAECRILDFTADAVKISYRPAPTAPIVDRLIPLVEVDYVELAPLPGEPEALSQAIREARSEPLITFWIKRLPWLGRPRTNTGEIGLTYAELLSRIATPDRMERALKVYEQIETADWSAERRGRAQAGKLRIMLRQGRAPEVLPLAEALLEKDGDPRVLIELRHVMAEAAASTLTQLEKDHPRWQDEDELGPRHQQLLNDALDGYLFPHLFHGAEEDLAARGLWAAASLSAAQKLTTQAADWSADLINLYATLPEAAVAKAWLEKQPVPVKALTPNPKTAKAEQNREDDPEEMSEEESIPDPEPAKTKPKPKVKPKAAKKTKTKEAGDE